MMAKTLRVGKEIQVHTQTLYATRRAKVHFLDM